MTLRERLRDWWRGYSDADVGAIPAWISWAESHPSSTAVDIPRRIGRAMIATGAHTVPIGDRKLILTDDGKPV